MKISKVENTRTGYAVLDDAHRGALSDTLVKDGQGIVYRTPAASDEYAGISLKDHIQTRNDNAMTMYSVLNSVVKFAKKEEKENIEFFIQYFNILIRAALEEGRRKGETLSIDERVDIEVQFFRNLYTKEIRLEDITLFQVKEFGIALQHANDTLQKIVSNNLRYSLQRSFKFDETKLDFPPIVKSVLAAVYYKNADATLSESDLRAFFKQVDKDYYKKEQLELIERSIESQSVKIKVTDNSNLLMLANADHPKKKYIFDFMREYCSFKPGERRKREELENHIQQLIRLYFYGESGYNDSRSVYAIATGTDSTDPDYLSEELKELFIKIRKQKEIVENKQSNKFAITKAKGIITKSEENILPYAAVAMSNNYRRAVAYVSGQKTILGYNDPEKKFGPDIFWVDYIDDVVNKLLINKKCISKEYRFQLKYLCVHVYKEWTQYIASKYIDLGKAVYHFVLPNLYEVKNHPIAIKQVQDDFKNGISGFEYERIKAEESLEREMAVYGAFAIHIFSQAAASERERGTEKHEDVLLMKTAREKERGEKGLAIELYSDAKRRFLQFFSGEMHYMGNSAIAGYDSQSMFSALRDELYAVRNATFHYTAETEGTVDHSLASVLLQDELENVGMVFRKKYYSTNVWKYYSIDNINTMMGYLYNDRADRASQVPSFNRILNRAAIVSQMEFFIDSEKKSALESLEDSDLIEQYWSALFFMLKEIYYYGFLQNEEKLKEYFLKQIEKLKEDGVANTSLSTEESAVVKNKEASEDFVKRLYEIGEEKSFGEICQGFMVEYHLQNNQIKTKKVEKVSKKKGTDQKKDNGPENFKHYRTLLYICIRKAFLNYLKDNWSWVSKPEYQENTLSEIDFCKDYHITMYDDLENCFSSDNILAPWYIAAHFMNQKYLNHLAGAIRNYLQFSHDIEVRAASVYNRAEIESRVQEKTEKYKRLLRILEFSINFCENINHSAEENPNWLNDYFPVNTLDQNDWEYDQFLSRLIDINRQTDDSGAISIGAAIRNFTDQIIDEETQQKVGTYYDAKNIIPNRNIILANMYGSRKRLVDYIYPVTLDDFKSKQKLKIQLKEVLITGICVSEEEQRLYREYQNLKNRTELVDIAIYTELLNDLHSQLINWAYLRERDRMYFLLGYHYVKLYWSGYFTDKNKNNEAAYSLSNKKAELRISEGSILYEIVSMYSYSLPLIIKQSGKWEFHEESESISEKGRLLEANFPNGEAVFAEGLELFENTHQKEQNQLKNLREYIDHFKYFSSPQPVSILDLYSQVYDQFFRYDIKLKKSVSFVLRNILTNYFMAIDTEIELKNPDTASGNNGHKETKINYGKKALQSTALTYPYFPEGKMADESRKAVGEKKTVTVEARSDYFLTEAKGILIAKKCELPKEEKDKKPKSKNGKVNGPKSHNQKYHQSTYQNKSKKRFNNTGNQNSRNS